MSTPINLSQNTSSPSSDYQKLLLPGMMLSMFCWGLSWTSGKVLSHYGAATEITFYRFAFTVLSLLFILPLFRVKWTISRRGLPSLLITSVLMTAYSVLFFKGLLQGYAGAGGVLVTTLCPVMSYVIMLLLARRLPDKQETLGIVLGLVAACLLLNLIADWQKVFESGNVYFLLAAFIWAIISLLTARTEKYGSPLTFSLWLYLLSVLQVMFLIDSQKIFHIAQQADGLFWGNLFFSATITTALATSFYFYITTQLGASRASSFIFLVPTSAALGAWVFLGEVPNLHTITGGLVGITAVYVLNKKTNV
ncbi:MAG: DMT family transporter [Gammaproteobacteria bacterium]|nr:DMT family transporter [Gammaproteobacteria bacterium]